MRTEKKVIKPLPKNHLAGYHNVSEVYIPQNEPQMVSDYTERQLQEMYPPLKDAYEQYQILLKMYDGKHQTLFQRARSV